MRDLEVAGYLGEPLRLRIFERGGEAGAALVLPGVGYTPAMPLLYYSRLVLLDAGLAVVEAWWETAPASGLERLEASAQAALQCLPATCRVVVAKSIGTRALACLEHDVPGVWLTPLLGDPRVRETLERRASPQLVIGGTADATFDREFAARLPHRVLEIEGGDHSLETGSANASLQELGSVVDAIESFSAAVSRADGP